jgi:hypothetical protein
MCVYAVLGWVNLHPLLVISLYLKCIWFSLLPYVGAILLVYCEYYVMVVVKTNCDAGVGLGVEFDF